MKIKKLLLPAIGVGAIACMASCDAKIDVEQVTLQDKSDTVYVRKLNLKDDFILGMDASSVIAEEESGVKYYDYDGKEQDVFKTLAESGINTIRVRVWNNPYDENGNGFGGGNNDIDRCVEIGKRATKYGMKLMVDFHYSDFWADPAKQQAPREWENMDIDAKSNALYKYTLNSLKKLKKAGVAVRMVQVGNETNGKLCGETSWTNIAKLMNSGSKAIRKVFPEAQVAVHFANPEKPDNYRNWAKDLADNNVDYDVFASSYYPYWHGTLYNLSDILDEIAKKYKKKVMVAETSYCFTEEDSDYSGNTIGENFNDRTYPFTVNGQANHIYNVCKTVSSLSDGIGVCYWEGTWITVGGSSYQENSALWEKYGSGWASRYSTAYDPVDAGKYYGGCAVDNQAMFDKNGKPLESLKVWAMLKNGNITTTFIDGAEDVSLEKFITDEFTLPEKVKVIYSDGSKKESPVTWDAFDIEEAKAKGNGKYRIHGIVGGKDVYCNLTLLDKNYVTNWSFEDTSGASWTRTSKTELNSSNKAEITKENPLTGKAAYHFWAANANQVNFEIEQELKDIEEGTYVMQSSILGGVSSGTTDTSKQNIYCYVKINGEIKYKMENKFKSYNEGYQTITLKNIEVKAGDKVSVGYHVEANQAGSWGDIDDIIFSVQR